MSIEKSNEKFKILGILYTPVCDICGEELPPENDFYDAVEAKKVAGWKSNLFKVEGRPDAWHDICRDCQYEVNKK